MENSITFDKAIEILEITDVSIITLDSLKKIERNARKRWHPDKVEFKKNHNLTDKYSLIFQQIEPAIELLRSYLKGNYHAGIPFDYNESNNINDPEEIIRKNSLNMQSKLNVLWKNVKEKKYKWEQKIVNLSDGFKLKDLLKEDFEYDIYYDTSFSFFFGSLYTFFAILFFYLLNFIWEDLDVINIVIFFIWGVFAILCFIYIIPLARFWLPKSFKNFIENIIYSVAFDDSWLISIIPIIINVVLKYIIIFPLYEIAKIFIGDKVVGVVDETVDYYANFADWYIEELLNKNTKLMSKEELFHLSHLYNELSGINNI